jgi:hypothetical protein
MGEGGGWADRSAHLRSVERLADVSKVDDDHSLRPLPHNLRRLHQEALAISRKLRIVGHQKRVHAVKQLFVLVLAPRRDRHKTVLVGDNTRVGSLASLAGLVARVDLVILTRLLAFARLLPLVLLVLLVLLLLLILGLLLLWVK